MNYQEGFLNILRCSETKESLKINGEYVVTVDRLNIP
jgi:hypothetical protein